MEAIDQKVVVLLLIILSLSVIDDYSRDKISNWIIAAGILSAGIVREVHSPERVLSLLTDLLLPILVLLLFYWLRGLGAGDLKLFSVISGLIGFEQCLYIILYAAIFGIGIAGVCRLAHHKREWVHFSLPIMAGTILELVLNL